MRDCHPHRRRRLPHETIAEGGRDFARRSATEPPCGTVRAAVDGVEKRADRERRIVPGAIRLFRHGRGPSEYRDTFAEAEPASDRLSTAR
jgi:hypothetical protein